MSDADDPTVPSYDGISPDDLDRTTPLAASPLDPADDAFVLGILQQAGPGAPLPTDVAARWDAAIAAEQSARVAAAAGAAAGAAGASVIPLDSARERGARRWRFAGVAASVAALALVGGLVTSAVLGDDPTAPGGEAVVAGGSAVAPDGAAANNAPLPVATTVSTSGVSFRPTQIAEQVQALLAERLGRPVTLPPTQDPAAGAPTTTAPDAAPPVAAAAPAETDRAATPDVADDTGALATPDGGAPGTTAPDATAAPGSSSGSASSGGSTSGGSSSGGSAGAGSAPLLTIQNDRWATLFRTSSDRRADCLAALNDGGGDAKPVVMDLGYFARRPAVLIVLPTEGDPARLDIWIVRTDCDRQDADVVWFGRIQRPF